MADGSVIIDTQLDESGLKTGLAKMAHGVNSGMTVALEAASTALVGLGTYAVSVGSEFEASMSNVAAISGATGDEIVALTEKAKEMGAQTKFSASEAADAFSYMAMAGWKTEDMLSGIEGIMNLAAASGEDLASVSDIVTDALTALGMSASESGHFADVLAAASSNANTNVGLMGETFKYCAAMAGSLHYSSEDLALAIGLMANSGLKGTMAGTSLNMIMTRLATNSNGAREAIEELGVAFFNEDGTARSLAVVMEELRTATANMTDEQKANFANTVAGTSAQKGLLAILNASTDDYNKLSDAIANCTDEETGFSAAAQMASTMMDNLQGDVTILKSATEGFGISLYDAINGVGDGSSMLREVVQYATELVNELNEAVNENGLGGLASAVGDVLAKAVSKIAEYIPVIVQGALDLVNSFIGGIAAAAPEIAGVAANIGVMLLDGLLGIRSQIYVLALDLVTSFANAIADEAPKIFESLSGYATGLVDIITEWTPLVLDAAVKLVAAIGEGIVQNLHGVVMKIADAIPRVVSTIASAIPGLLQTVLQSIEAVVPKLLDAAILIVQSLVQTIADNAGIIVECVEELVYGVIDILPGLLQTLANAIPGMIQQLVGVISSVLPDLLAAALNLVQALADMIADNAGILLDCVTDVVFGIVEMLPSIIQQICDALPGLLNTIVRAIVEYVPRLIEAGITLFMALVEALPEVLTAILGVLPDLIDGIVAGIKELLPALIQCGIELFLALVEALPEIIEAILEALPELITSIVGGILEMLPLLVDCGVQLFMALVQALPEIIYEIVQLLPDIIDAIVQTLIGMSGQIIACGIKLLTSLVSALPQIIITIVAVLPSIITSVVAALINCIPELIQCGIHLFTALIGALPDIIVAIVSAIPEIIAGIVNALISNIGVIIEAGFRLFFALIGALPEIIASIVSAIPQIITAIVDAFGSFIGQMVDVGWNLIVGIGEGISQAVGGIIDTIIDAADQILGSIKRFFGIASPSKLFKNEIGKNLMLGLAEGIDEASGAAVDAAIAVADDLAGVDMELPTPSFDGGQDFNLKRKVKGELDYDRLADEAIATVGANVYQTGRDVSSGSSSSSYAVGGDEKESSGSDEKTAPQFIQNDIIIDGHRAARVLTPYVAQELEWEDDT